jgi:mannose-1-phosphate guanylyltransferase/phosphomannomutase
MGVIVRAVKAKLGAFIDSPGERCFLVDETGELLDHETAFECLAHLAMHGGPGLVTGPASSSIAFEQIADQHGGRYMPSKIAPGAILRSAQHKETVLGSDGAGGYCWPNFQVAFDAAFTVVKVLELMAITGQTLHSVRAEIPHVGYKRVTLFCPWEVKGRVMRTMMERHLRDQVDLTDGVKVFVDGGWVLVVPDPDNPAYHVIASTRAQDQAERLVGEYSTMVRGIVGEVRAGAPAAE